MPYEARWKTGRTSAKVRATKSRRKFLQRTHPIQPFDPKLTFWCVSYYLSAFGTIWLSYETRCKTGRTRANVRATPLDHKLTFWCVSYYYFGAFGTVWLPYETRCTTGRTSAKGHATKSCQNFSQRTHPIHPIGP